MAIKKHSSKNKTAPADPYELMGIHIRELTAIHAHTDALALAIAGKGEFRDGELTAILFDLEERLMHVRDGFAGMPTLFKSVHHG